MNAPAATQTAIGNLVIKIAGQMDFRVDLKTFELNGKFLSITAHEGRGGNMEPKQDFSLRTPGFSGHYDYLALSATELRQYSDMYSLRYVPISGGGAVVIRSSNGADAAFSLGMELVEESAPAGMLFPKLILVHVALGFDLSP